MTSSNPYAPVEDSGATDEGPDAEETAEETGAVEPESGHADPEPEPEVEEEPEEEEPEEELTEAEEAAGVAQYPELDGVLEGTVASVAEWIGDDEAKAAAVLAAEQEGKNRKGVIGAANEVLGQ